MGLLGFAPPQGLPSGGGGSSSGVTIKDEGSSQGTATTLDFVGAGVSATVAAGTATITIPGGSGNDHTVVGGTTTIGKVTPESVTSSTALQDDDELTVSIVSGRSYVFEFMWRVVASGATNGGSKFAVGGTATYSSGEAIGNFFSDNGTNFGQITRLSSLNDGILITQAPGATFATYVAHIMGRITCNGNGTFCLRWAQETSDSDALSVYNGSTMRITRIS